MRSVAVLLTAALGALMAPASAWAQAPTHFYCYVPDPASGAVYMSPTLRVGPVAERARYGQDFADFLRRQGKASTSAQGYCVMRWSEAAVAESRSRRAEEPCPECAGARTFVAVDWPRESPASSGAPEAAAAAPAAKRASTADAAKRANDSYGRSIRESIAASDPGTCLVNADGSLRCTRGGKTTAAAAPTPAAQPAPAAVPPAARAEICLPDARNGAAAPQRCRTNPPKATAPAKPPVPPKVGANRACAPTTINIATGRIGVAVSPPGTRLLMWQRLTNRQFSFGAGTHSVPKDVYRLAAKAPQGASQPPQACVSFDQKAPKPAKPKAPPAKSPAPDSPSPPFDKSTQACTTLPRDRDTVIVVADPRIFVTMSPGTFLYMKDQLGNELKLGYGNHRIRPGAYKLGIYGVTDPFNPLKRSLSACVRYVPDY